MNKGVSKLVKKIVVLILIICFLFLLLFLTTGIGEREVSCRDGQGDGWNCRVHSASWLFRVKSVRYRVKCLLENGEFTQGFSLSESPSFTIRDERFLDTQYFECFIPFSDEKILCKNSNDCMGSCMLEGDIPDYCEEINPRGSDSMGPSRYVCSEVLLGVCTSEKKWEGYFVKDNEINYVPFSPVF